MKDLCCSYLFFFILYCIVLSYWWNVELFCLNFLTKLSVFNLRKKEIKRRKTDPKTDYAEDEKRKKYDHSPGTKCSTFITPHDPCH